MRVTSTREYLYYVSLFLFAVFEEGLQGLIIAHIGPVQLYAIDVFYGALIFIALRVLAFRRFALSGFVNVAYLIFLAWLVASVFAGFTHYGFRAFGEARYILPLFGFFVPYWLFPDSDPIVDSTKMRRVIERTFWLVAVGATVAFTITLVRLQAGSLSIDEGDFRGLRFVTGNQTFYLVLLAVYLLTKKLEVGVLTLAEKTAFVGSFVLGLLSKNRTPFVSLGLGVCALLLVRTQIGRLLRYGAAIAVVVFAVGLLFPELGEQVSVAFEGILHPMDDPTGQWRIGVQLAALDQALETPWLGQGFGGYFSFVVPGENNDLPYEFPPHNQFLMLFLKTGIVGLILSIVIIGAFVAGSLKGLRRTGLESVDRALIVTLLVLIATHVIYGLAYDFFPLFGLCYGFGARHLSLLNMRAREATRT